MLLVKAEFDKDIDNLTIVKDIRNYIKGIV